MSSPAADDVPSIEAGCWGLLAAAGLLVGALFAFFVELPHRVVAAVMGFGGGVLIALLSVDLMEKAFEEGGAGPTVGGFLIGALVFCVINWLLAKRAAQHSKRCGGCVQQPTEPRQKAAERSGAYIFGVWGRIALISGASAALGHLAFGGLVAGTLAFAASGVLAMPAKTMVPEAFQDAQPFISLVTVVGFLTAFLLIKADANM